MGSLPPINFDGVRQDTFSLRVRQLLTAMAQQYPVLGVKVDIYRLAVVNATGYPDDDKEVFIRLAEDIQGFNLEHEDKFYQAEVGLVRTRVNWLILPSGFNLEPDDHVVFNGLPYLITEGKEMMGVCRCTLSQPKNRFKRQGRFDPTYRQVNVGCIIA